MTTLREAIENDEVYVLNEIPEECQARIEEFRQEYERALTEPDYSYVRKFWERVKHLWKTTSWRDE